MSWWQKARDFTWRGPSGPWLVVIVACLILGLGILLAAGVSGITRGLAERQENAQLEIAGHFDRATDYLEAGNWELAAAELEMALRLDPGNSEIQQQLAGLQERASQPRLTEPLSGTLLPPPPALIAPSSTVTGTVTVFDVTYQEAQAAMQREEWPLALVLLDELAQANPDYRAQEIERLRFGALYQHGLELVDQGQYAEALQTLEQALALRPDDPDAQMQRDLIVRYRDAIAAWRRDWSIVVTNLEAILAVQSEYLDARERLARAEEAWGDDLAADGSWCQAQDHYEAAQTTLASPENQDKQEDAARLCANPPPTPTPRPSPTPDQPQAVDADSTTAVLGRLAFATYDPQFSRWNLYRVPATGQSRLSPLTQDASQPAISPAGTAIAVRSEAGDRTGVVVLAADGSFQRRLTTFAEDSHPQWSPDGQQIVFESNREGDRRWRLYRMWSGGGQETAMGFGRWPTWSPKGDTLAYQGCDQSGNRCGLWLMGADGGNPRALTDVPSDSMPAWSPDGARLAFASPGRTGNWDIYVVEVRSGVITPLAVHSAIDGHPAWSPDGSQVAFLSNRAGSWAIHVVDVASGRVSRAVVLPGQVPDWFEAQISWGR